MKLDANKDQSDPIKGPLCRRALVLFNGEFIDHVVRLDEEAGTVTVYQKAPNGKFLVSRSGSLIEATLTGNVKVIDTANVVSPDGVIV